jgi:hypothetical protein
VIEAPIWPVPVGSPRGIPLWAFGNKGERKDFRFLREYPEGDPTVAMKLPEVKLPLIASVQMKVTPMKAGANEKRQEPALA